MEPSEDELARRRRKLEAEKLAVEEEELQLKRQKLQMEKGASASILRLNVGGRTFDTTKETLLGARSHFFNRMLEEGDDSMLTGATRDADGRLFIDRSPEGFNLVLDYLRGALEVDKLDKERHAMLIREALYYDVKGLHRELHGGYDPFALSAADQNIRNRAMEIRQALARGDEGAAAEADKELVDVFKPDGGDTICLLHPGDSGAGEPSIEGMAILFAGDRKKKGLINPVVASEAAFRPRLDLFAGPLFEGLDLTNLVVAGGAVGHAFHIGDYTNARVREKAKDPDVSADVDLFIVADDEAMRGPPSIAFTSISSPESAWACTIIGSCSSCVRHWPSPSMRVIRSAQFRLSFGATRA